MIPGFENAFKKSKFQSKFIQFTNLAGIINRPTFGIRQSRLHCLIKKGAKKIATNVTSLSIAPIVRHSLENLGFEAGLIDLNFQNPFGLRQDPLLPVHGCLHTRSQTAGVSPDPSD